MQKSLLEASEKADTILHGSGSLDSRMKLMVELLRDLSNQWVREGHIK